MASVVEKVVGNLSGATALSGVSTAAKKVGTFRIIGDSICSQNDSAGVAATGGTSQSISKYPYWWNMVCWLTGNAIQNVTTISPVTNKRYGSNSGVGGDDLDELEARLPDVLARMKEQYLVFHIGTNAINAGESWSSITTKYVRMLNATLARGIIPIVTSVLPRNATDGASDWGATVTTAAQKRMVMNSVNNYMREWCRENGLRFVDFTALCSTVAGDMVTGGTADSVHPQGSISYFFAKKFISDCDDILPVGRTGQANGYDAFDATYNPYGNALNGEFAGTGGNISVGSGTGTVTGTVPDNWQLAKSTSTTTSCAAAIVARTDGRPGNVLELTFTAVGTGSASEDWRLSYWSGASTSLASFMTNGDLMVMEGEVEIVGGHGGVVKHPQIRVGTSSTGASKSGTTVSFDAATKQIRDSANGLGSFLANRLVIVTGSTSNNGVFQIESATAGVIQLKASETLVDESAGASVTLTLPSYSAVTGSSATTAPDLGSGKTTDVIYQRTPVMEAPFTGNCVPRFSIYIDGTKTGTGKVRIANPKLYKLPFRPELMDFLAHDE